MSESALRDLGIGGSSRAQYGLIVTAREQATGQQESFHEVDPPKTALTTICARLDELNAQGADWKIVSISTPSSIYRDLQGMRGGRDSIPEGDARYSSSDPRTTEQTSLGQISRLDLLQPLTMPGFDRGARRL